MKEIFKTIKFYLIFIIASAIIFLMFVNLNRSYISQTDIMVIFKSEKSAQNSDIILENLKLIPKSLSFYDKLTINNSDTQNETISELPNYKRKKYWDETIEIQRIGKSSFLSFVAYDKDSYTAEVLSAQTIKSLIATIGVYYDIKNDIDIRIVDGPTTTLAFSGSYIFYLFESIILGLILSFIFSYFFLLPKQALPKKKSETNLTWSYKEKTDDLKSEMPIAMETKKEKKSIFIPEEFIPISGKKSVAPDNLPIAEDIPVFEKPTKKEEQKEEIKSTLTHEATEEEVKARLNKLLSGKL